MGLDRGLSDEEPESDLVVGQPFGDKSEAQKGLDDFLDFIQLAEPKVLSTFYASLHTA